VLSAANGIKPPSINNSLTTIPLAEPPIDTLQGKSEMSEDAKVTRATFFPSLFKIQAASTPA